MDASKKIGKVVGIGAVYFKDLLGDSCDGMISLVATISPERLNNATIGDLKYDRKKFATEKIVLGKKIEEEQKTLNNLKNEYEKSYKVSENLNQSYENAADEATKSSLENSLTNYLTETEQKKDAYEKQKEKVDNLRELEEFYKEILANQTKQINENQDQFEEAQTSLDLAKTKQKSNELKAELEEMKTDSTEHFNPAVAAMKKKTAHIETDMAADELIKTLDSKTTIVDPNVLAAIAEVEGAPVKTSLSDKLAALKPKN